MGVTNFQSLKADVVNRNILSTEFFAEEVTYTPAGQAPRTVTAKVSGEQAAAADVDEEFTERIRVKVRRDATLGIDAPNMGDLVTRSITREPDRRPYVFTGEKLEITPSHWVLVFGRTLNTGRSPTG